MTLLTETDVLYQSPVVEAPAPLPMRSNPSYHAFRLLQITFVFAPLVAGLDKFFHVLVNWDQYLSPVVSQRLPIEIDLFMKGAGVVEMAAAFCVALRPKWGGILVAGWLSGIVLNLLSMRFYYDIALRDVGLALAALALSRLAVDFETPS